MEAKGGEGVGNNVHCIPAGAGVGSVRLVGFNVFRLAVVDRFLVGRFVPFLRVEALHHALDVA